MLKLAVRSTIETIATTVASDQRELDSATLMDGRIFTVWRTDGQFLGESLLRARIINTDGTPSNNDFLIQSTSSSLAYGTNNYNPVVEQLGSGRVFISWTSRYGDGSGTSIMGRIYSASGVPFGAEFVINTTKLNNQLYNQTIALSNGGVFVIYESNDLKTDQSVSGHMMRGCYFDANGLRVGKDFALDNLTDEINIETVVGQPDGETLLIYRHAPVGSGSWPGTFYAQRFDAFGEQVGPELKIGTRSTGSSLNLEVTKLSNGNVLFTWMSWEDALPNAQIIRSRMLDASGNFLSDDFDVDPQAVGANSFNQQGGTVAELSNGRLLMVYTRYWTEADDFGLLESHWAIVGVYLSPSGKKIGSTFQISDLAAWDCRDPNISVLPDGRAYVSWTTEDGSFDGSGSAVQGVYVGIVNSQRGTPLADHFHTGTLPDSVMGLAGNDSITTGVGADTLNGGIGVDTMIGGQGNDQYFVDNKLDVVVEMDSQGIDTITATCLFTLPNFVEVLIQGGLKGIVSNGNSLDNEMTGNIGDSTLNGGFGNDSIFGGLGNDILIGGLGEDYLVGGSGADTIDAGQGNDHIFGDDIQSNISGNDRIFGGDGNDTIDGGRGNDVLTGGVGSDLFVFRFDLAVDSSPAGVPTDIIADFNQDGGDVIDLSNVDANYKTFNNDAFTYIGPSTFSGVAGQLRFSSGYLQADLNGDGWADFQIQLVGTSVLSASSLLL